MRNGLARERCCNCVCVYVCVREREGQLYSCIAMLWFLLFNNYCYLHVIRAWSLSLLDIGIHISLLFPFPLLHYYNLAILCIIKLY